MLGSPLPDSESSTVMLTRTAHEQEVDDRRMSAKIRNSIQSARRGGIEEPGKIFPK